ncbi:ParB/RepB/Spo0J family partition protein [Actinomadura sp. 21ATH]|uniref:ParB/RepB/Spo0J family partition protein n=1 Tax=Actinomadura sp. 21ATH TaxID=1735444 RepID=UPI0035BF6898
MSQPRRRQPGLGRGLDALIPTRPPAAPPATAPGDPGDVPSNGTPAAAPPAAEPAPVGAHFAEIPVERIRRNPRQPREEFAEEPLAELAESISIVGLLQPVVVRRIDDPEHDYELVMGERRLRASKIAGLDAIPAIVRDTGDNDMLRDALMENLHRQQLNPIEEAAAYQQLLEDFGATHEQLATRIGRSRPHITNTLRLLNLPPDVQRRLAAGVLTAGHARALLGLSTEAQEQLAHRIVAEGLSVRTVEEIVALREVDEDPKAAPRQRRKQSTAPELRELADRLSDRYETKVRVDMGTKKGKIVVEFASMEDLDRIIKAMTLDDEPGGQAF